MRRLKILHVVDDFYPLYGGVTTVVDQLCESLSNIADVTVASISPKNKTFTELKRNYKIIRCKGYINKLTGDMHANISSDKNFKNFINNEDFDIVHCHIPLNLSSYVSKVAKKRKIPVIYTIHSLYWFDIKNFTKSKILANISTRFVVNNIQKKADFVWTVSNFCKNFLEKFGLNKNAMVVYNCTEDSFVNCNDLVNTPVMKKHRLNLLVVSRLVKIKNIDFVLKSISILKNKNLDIHAYIVGDGKHRKTLEKITKNLNLESNITFTGAITNRKLLEQYYKESDLVVFPSLADSAGLIHIEAAIFKKPTLAIKGTAVSEKIEDLYNGLLAENNLSDFSSKIEFAYKNKDTLLELGKNANKTLVNKYSDPKIIEELYKKYLNCIELYKNK